MKARVLGLYLPQFHPIPENDEAWGRGFTEWTNVAKARPLYRGHCQPRVPADLGFYDLRVPEVRQQQADLAREAGIEGFCYYHYWFGNGRMLLQRPFAEVLSSGQPDFPFCLCWANHDWTTATWTSDGGKRMIAKQEYPGEADYRAHFDYCLQAFRDHRYVTVDGKPLFLIYDPYNFADIRRFIDCWRRWAEEAGLQGIHFVAQMNSTSTLRRRADGTLERVMPNLESSAEVYRLMLDEGFDAINSYGRSRAEMLHMGKYRKILTRLIQRHSPVVPLQRVDYKAVVRHFFAPEDAWENVYPTILPQWDRSPRVGKGDVIYTNATPANFRTHVADAVRLVSTKEAEHRLIFLKSWNEWGEGNYVEPDQLYGHGFLEALRAELT